MALDVKALRDKCDDKLREGRSELVIVNANDVLALIALLEQAGAALESKEYDQYGEDGEQWCGECGVSVGHPHSDSCSFGAALAALRAAGVNTGGEK